MEVTFTFKFWVELVGGRFEFKEAGKIVPASKKQRGGLSLEIYGAWGYTLTPIFTTNLYVPTYEYVQVINSGTDN